MSQLLCGCTESTFAIQQHIKTKYVSQIWKLYFLSSLRDLFKVTDGRLLSLIRVCDKLKGTASEVAGWILFTSQPLWLVSSTGLEVIFNPKGQTLLFNLWFWKLFRPVSKKKTKNKVILFLACCECSCKVQVQLLWENYTRKKTKK